MAHNMHVWLSQHASKKIPLAYITHRNTSHTQRHDGPNWSRGIMLAQSVAAHLLACEKSPGERHEAPPGTADAVIDCLPRALSDGVCVLVRVPPCCTRATRDTRHRACVCARSGGEHDARAVLPIACLSHSVSSTARVYHCRGWPGPPLRRADGVVACSTRVQCCRPRRRGPPRSSRWTH
jgi:hypothetical protein